MSKLERWLTLVANLSVVAGIVFLAAEMRQNTQAIQAQTRDSITEKQMTWLASMYTNPEVADIWRAGAEGRLDTPAEWNVYSMAVGADLREWENSYYQYEHGLFSGDEFEARVDRWRRSLEVPGYRRVWASQRGGFSPSFRAEIDRIVAEVEQAQ